MDLERATLCQEKQSGCTTSEEGVESTAGQSLEWTRKGPGMTRSDVLGVAVWLPWSGPFTSQQFGTLGETSLPPHLKARCGS